MRNNGNRKVKWNEGADLRRLLGFKSEERAVAKICREVRCAEREGERERVECVCGVFEDKDN